MGNSVTSQFAGDSFPRLGSMTPYQPAEKPLGVRRIAPVLQKNFDDIPVLVDGTPQITLFPADPDEDFIDVERVAEPPMPTPQPRGEFRPKLDAPEANRLVAHANTPFRQQFFDIPMAQIESMMQPDRVDNVNFFCVCQTRSILRNLVITVCCNDSFC